MTFARSGILVVDKAGGITSADVVGIVRRALRCRRVGHAGTLDPDATGVLPILIGEATKLMPYLVDQDKEYRVTAQFGVTTDTHDRSGRVLSTALVEDLDRSQVEDAVAPFVGRIRQVPPMYSALHHAGTRLYELARAGVEVEREPREVVIHDIVVEDVSGATATLRIVCGKGTYMRVLVAEVGARLGAGAVVDRLIRTRVGPFSLDTAVSSTEVTVEGEAAWRRVLPPDAALGVWPKLHLDVPAAASFTHGQSVTADVAMASSGRFAAVYDRWGFLGIGEISGAEPRVRPVRILHANRPGTRVLPV